MVEKLEGLLSLANQAPGLIAMTGDMFDEAMANAMAEGIDISDLATYAKLVSKSLTQAQHMPEAKSRRYLLDAPGTQRSGPPKGAGLLNEFCQSLRTTTALN